MRNPTISGMSTKHYGKCRKSLINVEVDSCKTTAGVSESSQIDDLMQHNSIWCWVYTSCQCCAKKYLSGTFTGELIISCSVSLWSFFFKPSNFKSQACFENLFPLTLKSTHKYIFSTVRLCALAERLSNIFKKPCLFSACIFLDFSSSETPGSH